MRKSSEFSEKIGSIAVVMLLAAVGITWHVLKTEPMAEASASVVRDVAEPARSESPRVRVAEAQPTFWKSVPLESSDPLPIVEEQEVPPRENVHTDSLPVLVQPEKELIFKHVPIADLGLSPALVERIEEDQKRLKMNMTVMAGASAPSTSARVGLAPTSNGAAQTSLSSSSASGPFAHRIVSFTPGVNDLGEPIRSVPDDPTQRLAFLADLEPSIAGPPDFSTDSEVATLDRLITFGRCGEMILEVVGADLMDGEGTDFVVFENPFVYQGAGGALEVYAETATVAVAEVNEASAFKEFPCDAENAPYPGCAGVIPVSYRSNLSLTEVGGDPFDLRTIGVSKARFIRIRDTGDTRSFAIGSEGFDLDAVGLLHRQAR